MVTVCEKYKVSIISDSSTSYSEWRTLFRENTYIELLNRYRMVKISGIHDYAFHGVCQPIGVSTKNQRGRGSGSCFLWGGLDKSRWIVPTTLLVRVKHWMKDLYKTVEGPSTRPIVLSMITGSYFLLRKYKSNKYSPVLKRGRKQCIWRFPTCILSNKRKVPNIKLNHKFIFNVNDSIWVSM